MRSRQFFILLALAAVLTAVIHPLAQTPGTPDISEARYMSHVKFLASDDLGGRGNGAPGLERAAEYVAGQFRAAGLRPGMGVSWFQPFRIVTGLEVGEGNRLAIAGERGQTAFELGRSYVPLSVSADAPVTSGAAGPLPLVFAGYGISAPALRYDDYEGVDVSGKAIVDLHARAAGRRREEPVRRPHLHAAREPDAEGHDRA